MTSVGNCEFSINDQLFFETLIMLLRGESISYGSFIKKQNISREKELERNIEVLEQRLVTSNDKTALLKELSDKKSQLETYRLKVNDGIIMRSRIKWMELGERSSKYCLNLCKKGPRIHSQTLCIGVWLFYFEGYKTAPVETQE